MVKYVSVDRWPISSHAHLNAPVIPPPPLRLGVEGRGQVGGGRLESASSMRGRLSRENGEEKKQIVSDQSN